jgi:hypothetical protein
MTNDYEIRGDCAYIQLNRKGQTVEAIIDLADLERVKDFPGSWYARCKKGSDEVLGVTGIQSSRRHSTTLGRWLFPKLPSSHIVIYATGNRLDHRRGALTTKSRGDFLYGGYDCYAK